MGRDWGSPEIPEKVDLKTMVRMAPKVATKPRWLYQFGRTGQIPDLTAPNLAPPGGAQAPTFFGAYYEWMTTPPPSWDDVAWMRETWAQLSGTPFMLKGVCRVDDALRAVDAGVSAISVSNHGGNNLDGTPAAIRMLQPIADAVGDQIEVVMDGGVRRGSDVVKALALGARAVMIGRAYLWGLAANGQAGVENVLDVLRGGIDSALLGWASPRSTSSTPEHAAWCPTGFHRASRAVAVRHDAWLAGGRHQSPRPSGSRLVAGARRLARAARPAPAAGHRHHRSRSRWRPAWPSGSVTRARRRGSRRRVTYGVQRRAPVLRGHQLDRHRRTAPAARRAGPVAAHLGGAGRARQRPRRQPRRR